MFVIFLYLHFVKGVLHLSTLCAPLFYMLTLVHTTDTSETFAVNNKLFFFFFLHWSCSHCYEWHRKNSLRDSLHSVLHHLRLKLVVVFSTVGRGNLTASARPGIVLAPNLPVGLWYSFQRFLLWCDEWLCNYIVMWANLAILTYCSCYYSRPSKPSDFLLTDALQNTSVCPNSCKYLIVCFFLVDLPLKRVL